MKLSISFDRKNDKHLKPVDRQKGVALKRQIAV